MKFIDTQDSDKLRDIPQATAEGQNGNENEEINGNLLPIVPGHYTDLKERLLQMADLYLYLDHHKANFLIWFGREKGHFLVASGADGAPFGKANEACVWLVSFFKKELQLEFEPVVGPVIQNGTCDPTWEIIAGCIGRNCFSPMFCLRQRFLLVQNLFLICLMKIHWESIWQLSGFN